MQNSSKILAGAGALLVLVLIGVAIGRIAGSGTKVPLAPAPVTPTITQDSNPANIAAQRPTPPRVRPTLATNVLPANPVENSVPVAVVDTANSSTNWEAKLDSILDSETDDTNKVKELYAMFPTLPDDGKQAAAEHLSNLVEDEDYAPLGRMLADAKLPPDVLDTLMSDLLNRPNAIKLPLFLELARNPNHPQHEEARDLLELYLDEDYGTDWATWQKKIDEWLKDPDNQD